MHEQEADSGHTSERPDELKTGQEKPTPNSNEAAAEDLWKRQEGRDGDVLAWIEGPAFNAPIEEMPTLHWPEGQPDEEAEDAEPKEFDTDRVASSPTGSERKDDESQDDLEDAMIWLEQLAAGQGTPIDEMPTLISGGEYDEIITDELTIDFGITENIGPTTGMSVDDSDPMAWLEQLAVDQDSPLEELPSVADRLLASEIISQNDVESALTPSVSKSIPLAINVEEALSYLEQLASSDGIALDDVDIDQVVPVDLAEDNLNVIDQMVEVAPAVLVLNEETDDQTEQSVKSGWDELSEQIPDDPDEALAWLSGLSDDEPVTEAGSDFAEGAALGSAEEEHQYLETALDIGTLAEMPDDPDEAMVWMQGLAEQQNEATVLANSHDSDDSSGENKGASPDVSELVQSAPEPVGGVEAQKSKVDVLNNEKLERARTAQSMGDLDQATEIYYEMVESGTGGAKLLEELERAVNQQPNSPELVKLLGDAYMQNGQMQKALSTYRKGFDHM